MPLEASMSAHGARPLRRHLAHRGAHFASIARHGCAVTMQRRHRRLLPVGVAAPKRRTQAEHNVEAARTSERRCLAQAGRLQKRETNMLDTALERLRGAGVRLSGRSRAIMAVSAKGAGTHKALPLGAMLDVAFHDAMRTRDRSWSRCPLRLAKIMLAPVDRVAHEGARGVTMHVHFKSRGSKTRTRAGATTTVAFVVGGINHLGVIRGYFGGGMCVELLTSGSSSAWRRRLSGLASGLSWPTTSLAPCG